MEATILELIAEHFGVAVSEISDALELRRDLNASDLEIADFFQKLEETFHITISKDEGVELLTVRDIINVVTDHAEEIT